MKIEFMKKIYISGPISGYSYEERQQYFAKVQEILELVGYEVKNPLDNGLPSDSTTHQHMREDLKMLLECDEIFMLQDWNRSAGCQTELNVAVAAGMKVIFENANTSIPTSVITPIGDLTVVQTNFK